tara:strand:+ start:510 stop:1229 length:720 start_codon:yes stop_codon:yes gene_type:complete
MYIYSGTNILIMAEPMIIIHEYEDYNKVYTIDTNDKRKALRAFINALYREMCIEELRIPNRLLYLKTAWDMMNGDNPDGFNIIANRIKPGRNLPLYDFLYTPRYGKSVIPFRRGTYYIEREDIDENDLHMKIFVGNFVFRVEPNTLLQLLENVQSLFVITGFVIPELNTFPYGKMVLSEYNETVQRNRHLFPLDNINTNSHRFLSILDNIKEGTEMDFFDFIDYVEVRTKTKTNAKLRL